jgi:hypothetical protein
VSHSGEAIFVGIASYCDTELDLTLTQLFDKAKDASRVYVGLVLQEHKAVRDAPHMVGGCVQYKLNPVWTYSLKPPDFNP